MPVSNIFGGVFGSLFNGIGSSSSGDFYDFTLGTLPTGTTLTRASSGYRYNSSGVLVSETTDVARFTYTPVTLAARGLLVESAGTNLLTYSEQFDNAIWSPGTSNGTVTVNATTAPDGNVTADTFTENAVGVVGHGPGRQVTFTTLTTYAISVYAKPNGRNWIYIYVDPARFGGGGYTFFNVATGAVGTTLAGATAFTTLEANGFYRCTVIATTSGPTGIGNYGIGTASADNTPAYLGDGVSGLYLWGATIVAESARSSYIQTVAAAATRAADVALITNASAISDQCWIIRARTPRKISGGATNVLFTVDDGYFFNRRLIYYSTTGRLIVAAAIANVTTCNIDLGAVAADTDFTIAVRWADNNFAASLNGGAIGTDLSGANPLGLTTARVGRDDSGNYWNSTIKTIETRRTASDTELPLLAA
jgi:hypothetical protein